MCIRDSYQDELILAAINAWNWGDQNPDVTFYNSGIIVSGEQQTSAYETDMRKMIAAIYLYDATANLVYSQYVDTHYMDSHMMQWEYVYPFETAIQNALIKYSIMPGSGSDVSAAIQNVYINSVAENNEDNLPAYTNATDAYMAYMADQNYTWGSNTFKARQAMLLDNIEFYNLSGNSQFKDAAEGYLHYFHGVNPNDICFLSNMNQSGAEKSVNSFYHAWFTDGNALWDEVGVSVYGPPPGFIPGGANPTYSLDACCNNDCGSNIANLMCNQDFVTPPLNQPIQKSWRDWNAGWPQNSWTITEVAIYTQAAYIKLLSRFVSEECLIVSSLEEQTIQKLALRLFPNPCNDELILSTELLRAGTSEVNIIDNFGKSVSSFIYDNRSGKSAHIIDTSSLTNGIYFLQVVNGEAMATKKFVVMR